mgnify:CR=1 FL=1
MCDTVGCGVRLCAARVGLCVRLAVDPPGAQAEWEAFGVQDLRADHFIWVRLPICHEEKVRILFLDLGGSSGPPRKNW